MNKIRYSVDDGKISWKKVADETVVLNIDSGFYYVLDEVASSIWQMTIDHRDTDHIVSKVTQKYDVSLAACQKDILNFLKNLEDRGLIKKSQKKIDPKQTKIGIVSVYNKKTKYKKPILRQYEQLHEVGVGS